jgi:hypothetical protein
MLSIKVNNQFLELGNADFNFTLLNPIFTKLGLKKAFSFPVKVDATAINNGIFNHAYRLDTTVINFKMEAIIYLFGNEFLSGYLKIDNRTNDSYDLTFTDYTTDFVNELDRITIKDVLKETITVVTAPANFRLKLKNTPEPIPKNAEIGFKINGEIFSHEITAIGGQTKASAITALIGLVNATYAGAAGGYINSDTIILTQQQSVEAFILLAADFQTWHSYEWTYEVANYQHEIHETAYTSYLANVKSAALDSLKVAYARILNGSLYEANTVYRNVINDYNSNYLLNDTAHDKGEWEYTLSPYVSLRYIFEQILSTLNFANLEGSFLSELETLFLHHSKTIDSEIGGQTASEFYNAFKRTFDLDTFVPNISAAQLFEVVRSSFLVAFFENNKSLKIESINDIIQQSAEDWTDKATELYGWNTPLFEGLTIEIQEDPKDDARKYDTKVVGEGKNKYPLAATIYGTGYVEQPLNSDFILKLLKYTHDTNPSCENYTTPDDFYTDNKKLLDLINQGKYLKKILGLSSVDLLKIVTFENPIKEIQHEAGRVVGVVKSVSFKANAKGISESTVDLLCF